MPAWRFARGAPVAWVVVLLVAVPVLAGGAAVAPARHGEVGLRDPASPCDGIAALYPNLRAYSAAGIAPRRYAKLYTLCVRASW